MRKAQKWLRDYNAAGGAVVVTAGLVSQWGTLAVIIAALGASFLAWWESATQYGYLPIFLVGIFTFACGLHIRNNWSRQSGTHQKAAVSATETDAPEPRVADVQISHVVPHHINEPAKLMLRIEFKKHSPDTDIFVNWASFVGYVGDPNAWKWSEQTSIIEGKSCPVGRRFDREIADLPVSGSQITILGQTYAARDGRSPTHICIEVAISSGVAVQRHRQVIALVSTKSGIAAFLLPPERFVGMVDE